MASLVAITDEDIIAVADDTLSNLKKRKEDEGLDFPLRKDIILQLSRGWGIDLDSARKAVIYMETNNDNYLRSNGYQFPA